MLRDPSTCPRELLLFFHNVGWDEAIATGGNTSTPMLKLISQGHHTGVVNAGLLADDWDRLEGMVDTVRFKGVQGRFKQQVNDAGVFTKVILGFYQNMSTMSTIQT